MSRFYFEQLLIQGENRPDAIVDFKPGVNFIIGPSNTGKSLIMDSIDYVFGFSPTKKKPFRFDPKFGYTEFTLTIRTQKGSVILKRSTEKNKTKVNLSGTDPDFQNGTYHVSGGEPTLNEVYLKLMGINEPHFVWSSADGRKNQFTWRNVLHTFFLKQGLVSRETSVLLNPNAAIGTNDTSVIYSLLFMLSAEDAEDGENPDTAAKKKAKREAVVEYIRQNVERLKKREDELREQLQASQAPDVIAAIAAITTEISQMDNKIAASIYRSKELMDEIYSANSQLSEYSVMQNRFDALRSQYMSDIRRLSFVIDGECTRAQQPVSRKCPFCDGEIHIEHKPIFIDATRAELEHIENHLASLDEAAADLSTKISAVKQTLASLEAEKASVDQTLNNELQPKFAALKTRLADYNAYVRLTKEIEMIEEDEKRYSGELLAREINRDESPKEHDYKTDFDIKDIHAFETILIEILRQSGFNGYSSARLNLDTFDLEIGGRLKSLTNGGGYCGILNTILALAMMEFLLEYGSYPPGLLLADSSLTQLSESESKARGETIKAKFIKYIIEHKRDGQVVLIEHKEKVPVDMIISSDANVIEFTGDESVKGRYGLLPDERNRV